MEAGRELMSYGWMAFVGELFIDAIRLARKTMMRKRKRRVFKFKTTIDARYE